MLLLRHTPNIGHLSTSESSNASYFDDATVSRYWELPLIPGLPSQVTPTYHRLKQVSISEYRVEVSQFATAMKLPALDNLHVGGLQERNQTSSWTWDAALFPEGSSNVRKPDFYGECLHAVALAIFVKCCRTLHHLSYAQLCNDGGNLPLYQPHSTNFKTIIEALKKHRGSLRSLALYNTGATDPGISTDWTTTSLAGFDTLERVCVDASVLFEQTSWVDCSAKVPSSVLYMRFQNTWLSLMQDFEDQQGTLSVPKDRTLHPHLKYLVISKDEDFWSRHDDEECPTTIPVLQDQGIAVRFLENVNDPLWTVAGWQEH
jgi:hypothetical protein